MKRVHKQVVDLTGDWQPIGGVPLFFDVQHGEFTVWYETHDKPIGGLHVKVFGTGHPIPERADYVDSINDGFVWHLYSMRD